MRRIFLATTSIIAVSGMAFAADLPSRLAPNVPPPVMQAFSWTGFYVGGSSGYLTGTSKVTDVNATTFGTIPAAVPGTTTTNKSSGGIYGVNAGYNFQTGHFVLGVEADYGFTSAPKSTDFLGGGLVPGGAGVGGVTVATKVTSLGTVRGRLGVAFDRTLFYVTGGWAYGQVRDQVTAYADPTFTAMSRKSRTGWTFGGGVEYAVTPNWTLRAEGLYVDLGKTSAVDANGVGLYKFKNTAVVTRVGLNYKF